MRSTYPFGFQPSFTPAENSGAEKRAENDHKLSFHQRDWQENFARENQYFDNDDFGADFSNYNYEWEAPQNIWGDSEIFGKEEQQDFPMFYFNENQQKPKVAEAASASPTRQQDMQESVKLVENEVVGQEVNETGDENQGFSSTAKSESSSQRGYSTQNCHSVADSKEKHSEEKSTISPGKFENPDVMVKKEQSDENKPKMEEPKADEDDEPKQEDDPDFCYKAPKKQKFEYNKRKDVILKTILRKCRRVLQDEFNELTGYFANRKMQGHQFLKDCITKFHDSLPNKPEQLDLLFYLGSVLYPQEMSRGVDCFFESDKNERVKLRKFYRAKIQKVHDVLYRYSHEKMDYFVNVPELSYIYSLFYKKEDSHKGEDIYYMNGATEIFERCSSTLKQAGVSI